MVCILIKLAMDFVQRMKRALQRGRSATLPPGKSVLLSQSFAVIKVCVQHFVGGEEEAGREMGQVTADDDLDGWLRSSSMLS